MCHSMNTLMSLIERLGMLLLYCMLFNCGLLIISMVTDYNRVVFDFSADFKGLCVLQVDSMVILRFW